MSAITAKASRKMKKYAVLTREPRCFLGSFDFSWEQRKFGEITSKYEDPVPTPHDGYYRLGIRSHAKGTFHSYVAKGQELETAQMHRVAAGNFIVNITFGWEHAVAITDKNDAGKLVSHRFPQFSFAEGMVPEFFRYVIVDEKFRHHLWLASPGGAGRNRVLKLDEMLNYLMRFPSRDEQIKIAEFFRHLDNLITLHQRKYVFLFGFFQAFISMIFTASTFSWEQRKLSELTSMHARIGWQNLRTSEFLDSGDYMLITGTDFNDGAINFSTCHYVERERYEQDRNIQIHNGSILITKDGTLGKVAYVQGLSMPATLNAGVFNVQIKDANNVDERYLFQYLKAPFLMDYVDKKATGGTIKHLNQSILVDFPVILPQRSEQILIGAFFQQLDNLITLHQRECISFTARAGRRILSANKKRNTSSWEQRKLGELVDVCSGRDYKHLSEGTIPVYGTGGYMLSVNDALSYDRDAIGIGRKGTIDRPYILKAPFWTVDTLFYAIPREKADLNFAFDIFQNIDWKKKDESTGVPSLSKTAINDIDVLAPKHGEQQAIGQFFAAIDHLITLHQRKPFLMKWRTSDANRNKTNRLVL